MLVEMFMIVRPTKMPDIYLLKKLGCNWLMIDVKKSCLLQISDFESDESLDCDFLVCNTV
jgi:hypothetical protein